MKVSKLLKKVLCMFVVLFAMHNRVYGSQIPAGYFNPDTQGSDVDSGIVSENLILFEESNLVAASSKIKANTSNTSDQYDSSWTYWSQGASKYSAVRSGGCRAVAYSKLIKEAGYSLDNPDRFFEWGVGRGYYSSTGSVYEQVGFGVPLTNYISEKGGSCSLVKTVTLSNDSTDKANIMSYINQGYYVILSCSSHTAYVGRGASISNGKPMILDSWSSWSYNSATTHAFIGAYDSSSKVTFTKYRVYKVSSPASSTPAKDTTPPVISNIQVSALSNSGYTVTCTVTDNVCVSKVQFPTWTSSNGQDDLIWSAAYSQVGTATSQSATFFAKAADHNNEGGWYNTHIYAYDTSGNCTSAAIPQQYVDRTAPVISNVKISDVSADGYTVSCTVTDDGSVNRVQFPSWTNNNDQDDIISDWLTNSAASGAKSGSTYTYRVNRSAHKNELKGYNTHIYAYDNAGNSSMKGVSVDCLLGNRVDIGQLYYSLIQNVGTGTYLTYDKTNAFGKARDRSSYNQEWLFVRMSDGTYTIIPAMYSILYGDGKDDPTLQVNGSNEVVSISGGKCLDVAGAADASATNVCVYSSNNTKAQRWSIYKASDGYYLVPECALTQALDLDAASGNLQTYQCGKVKPQYFRIIHFSEEVPENGNSGSTGGNEDKSENSQINRPADDDFDEDDDYDDLLNFENIDEDSSGKKTESKKNENIISIGKNGTAVLATLKKSSKKSITVPSTVKMSGNTYSVVGIGANAFRNCKKASTVTLPGSVIKIKARAFAKSKITTLKIYVKKGSRLAVDKKAFKDSKVKKVQIIMSKNASSAEKKAAKNAFVKAGIKKSNVRIKLR